MMEPNGNVSLHRYPEVFLNVYLLLLLHVYEMLGFKGVCVFLLYASELNLS